SEASSLPAPWDWLSAWDWPWDWPWAWAWPFPSPWLAAEGAPAAGGGDDVFDEAHPAAKTARSGTAKRRMRRTSASGEGRVCTRSWRRGLLQRLRETCDGGVRFRDEPGHQLGRGKPPRHARALPGPQREELGAPCLRGGGAQIAGERVLQREGQDRLGIAIHLFHETVHDPPRRPPREGPRQTGGVVASPEQRLLVALGRPGLVGGEERGPQLDG